MLNGAALQSVDAPAVSLACHAIRIQEKVSHVVICMLPPISVLYLQFQSVLPELFFVHFQSFFKDNWRKPKGWLCFYSRRRQTTLIFLLNEFSPCVGWVCSVLTSVLLISVKT